MNFLENGPSAPVMTGQKAYTERQELSNDQQALMRQEEAAALLGVTPRCMENWRHRGDGPKYVRVSHRCIRYQRGDLVTWIEERVRRSTSDLGQEARGHE